MSSPEQTRSGENPTQKAFSIMFQTFEASRPSIPEMKGTQHIRKLNDGTEMGMSRYLTRETTKSTGVNYAISVHISNPHRNLNIIFAITENGLVSISTGRKSTVTLTSHLYPRSDDNLQVIYEGRESEKPLAAFRNASQILVGWVKEMVDKDSSLPCPVTITEKKAKR